MDTFELNKKLDVLLKKEAERIINVLLDLYNKKTRVNKSFNKLFNEIIQDKYKPYSNKIQHFAVSLIPFDLMICPNYEWVFVTEEEFNKYYNEQKNQYLIENEKAIRNFLKEEKNV